MHIKEWKNKKNELVGYRLSCSGKDPKTGKYKVYHKVWHIPRNITPKETKKLLKQAEVEWENQVEKMSYGTATLNNNVTFTERAELFGQELKDNKQYGYYEKYVNAIPIISEFFARYKVKEINKYIVKNFYKKLNARTYIKSVTIVKRSLTELIKERKLKVQDIADDCGFNRLTIRCASKIGERINKKTAIKLCNHLKVDLHKYFDVKEQEVNYKVDTNIGIKSILSAILTRAVVDELIDVNPCSLVEDGVLTGAETTEKEPYTTQETQEFIKHALQEKDIRKRVAFTLYIVCGIRGCELTGLEWKDFDVKNQSIKIQRNNIYTASFGTQTKGTKSKSSTRILPLDDDILNLLLEYRLWWQEQKQLHGDLWGNIDRLFVNSKYQPTSRSTISQWLGFFCDSHGLRHIPPHTLRHTNITQKLIHNIDPLTVAGDAGHRDARLIMQRYGHYMTESAKKSAKQMNKIFFDKADERPHGIKVVNNG